MDDDYKYLNVSASVLLALCASCITALNLLHLKFTLEWTHCMCDTLEWTHCMCDTLEWTHCMCDTRVDTLHV